MTLRDLDLFLKRLALADTVGNANEQAEARRQVADMEREHPGIRAKALRVQQLVEGVEAPAPASAGWQSFLRGVAQQGVAQFADELAGEVSGARRFETLKRGACVLTVHRCSPGQVCLEMRVRARDVRNADARDQILDGVEEELLRLAEE